MKDYGTLFALVVDDDEVQRLVMEKLLRRLGFKHITVVGSGEAALAHLHEHLVHIVFTDYEMPGGMDGLTLTAEIAKGRLTRHIPVVMVTTIDTAELKTMLGHWRGRHLQKIGLTGDRIRHVLQDIFRS